MVESKQVKVDNWGIFFLQRLQQFYNKTFFCDLTLQFEDNVLIKVHRLVLNTCTEYFQTLERTCEVQDNCLIMPPNLPSDVVIPIINFMYSGILEFHESSFDRLYTTARLMNMSVLTKLLDAQKSPLKPATLAPKKVQSVTPITWNLHGKKLTKMFPEPELPETLPGRKLPIWKRKAAPSSLSFLSSNTTYDNMYLPKVVKMCHDDTPKPTRFEWPDDDSSFENSFDDISYTSKPLILPSMVQMFDRSPKPSTSTFEEIKKTACPVKRSASPIGNACKKVNIQDVKEYLKEHKIRSDYIDYDDSEAADNDLQPYNQSEDSNEELPKPDIFSQSCEETPNKSILKSEPTTVHPNKHVRFSLDGKDDPEKKTSPTSVKPAIKPSVIATKSDTNVADVGKHTKIITEVLKKYPHLVKNNKNIRLKILAKSNNGNTKSASSKTSSSKPLTKVSYMVVKPENQKQGQSEKDKPGPDSTKWECTRCEEPQSFTSYHTYRQHLTEAHNEKQDSQMCILCGHISRKQNMLVYHKYVKHNIPPPAMYTFPKCKECPYIAPSPTILQKHMTTHIMVQHLISQDRSDQQHACNQCDKKFYSEDKLRAHIESHENQPIDVKVETAEENQEVLSKSKDKIKILSDIKVSGSLPTLTRISKEENLPNQNAEQIEQSSEAEALSNVASGIAASLGLVDTIVVLDDNQFILQSQHGNIQQNILNPTTSEYIIPEMQVDNMATIVTSSIDQVAHHATATLSSDTNTVLTQSLHKTGINSTDELVMVLTDHDYSDAANNAVITDNSIVVLYSHPVQTQATTMMLTSEAGVIEVGKNYTVASNIPVNLQERPPHCEESIEMIQQEINNQLDPETGPQEQNTQIIQYISADEAKQIHMEPENIQRNEPENIYMSGEMEQCINEEKSDETQNISPDNADNSIQIIQDVPADAQIFNSKSGGDDANKELQSSVEENDHGANTEVDNSTEIRTEEDQMDTTVEGRSSDVILHANTEGRQQETDTYEEKVEENKESTTDDVNISKTDSEATPSEEDTSPENSEGDTSTVLSTENNSDSFTLRVESDSEQSMTEAEPSQENFVHYRAESNLVVEEKETSKNDENGMNDNDTSEEAKTEVDSESQMFSSEESMLQRHPEEEASCDSIQNEENSNSPKSEDPAHAEEISQIVKDTTNEAIEEIINDTRTKLQMSEKTSQEEGINDESQEMVNEGREIVNESQEMVHESQEVNNDESQEVINEDTEEMINEEHQAVCNEESQEIVNEGNQEIVNEENQEIVNKENQEIVNEENQEIVNEENQEIINKGNHEIVNEENQEVVNEENQKLVNEQNQQIVNEENQEIIHESQESINIDEKITENRELIVTEENLQSEPNNENTNEQVAHEEKPTTTRNQSRSKDKNIEDAVQNDRISKILDDWDDGDTDSQQSASKPDSAINKLIDDWDEEEDT